MVMVVKVQVEKIVMNEQSCQEGVVDDDGTHVLSAIL